jgi:hypothetical protein
VNIKGNRSDEGAGPQSTTLKTEKILPDNKNGGVHTSPHHVPLRTDH